MTWDNFLALLDSYGRDALTFLVCFLVMAILEEYWVRSGHPPTRWR